MTHTSRHQALIFGGVGRMMRNRRRRVIFVIQCCQTACADEWGLVRARLAEKPLFIGTGLQL
jgi:hypothetical protein